MHHTKTYRSTRRRWNSMTDQMSDADLIRAHMTATDALDVACTPTNQARFDAIEAEIDHRDCWL
ncbi:hypothetical protein [Novosphingobium clariflavum]|uniref:Uncharacterized protein n=1 Tax=Novosphingobium clariflavum TaxID=2029884 RepID=A0ABV6S2Z7_9SPHN|nr:hypothetical protein [Novosphingobium clariflavum]